MLKADQVIDVKGKICPSPLILAKQALKSLGVGQVLHVISDDMTTKITFPSFFGRSDYELLSTHEDGPTVHHYIRKK